MLLPKPSDFTILMVDDNPKNLQLLGTTLRNEGYKLEFATSGAIALHWLERRPFDLVLLDIMMPGMSGFEVCTSMRTDPNNTDTPIIFITAKADKDSILEGFKMGAQDYITKPFDSAELLARVRTQLELKHSRAQLKVWNEVLEQKVAERTRELEETVQLLHIANNELLELDKSKSEFLHIIAHEIRTPLNGIKGSLQILKEHREISNFGTLFSILDQSVHRLEKFALIALKITQLKTGKWTFDFQPLPYQLLINTAITKCTSKLAKKEIAIETGIAQDDIMFHCDFEMLSNALHIILDNAIQFTPAGTKIWVNAWATNAAVHFEIIDEGPGFTQKALDHLFELFAPGVKHINENEGLELALVKLIVDAHKGTIAVENLEKGAKVSLSLPL